MEMSLSSNKLRFLTEKSPLYVSALGQRAGKKKHPAKGGISHLSLKMPKSQHREQNGQSLYPYKGCSRAQGQHPAVAPHSPTERKAEGQGSAQGEIYLNIEVCEERDQGDHVPDLEIQPPEGEATPPEESAARLNDCQHKLDLEEQGQC